MESSNIQVYVVSHSVDDIKDIDANDIYTPLGKTVLQIS